VGTGSPISFRCKFLERMSETEQVRRIVTVVYVATIAAVGVCFLLVAWLPVPASPSTPSVRVRWTLLALGAGEYLFATILAQRKVSSSARGALERVRSGYLIRFAAAGAIATFGITLHFLGTPASSVLFFLGLSIAALVLAYPSRKAFEQARP
jgi:hypothetical protein